MSWPFVDRRRRVGASALALGALVMAVGVMALGGAARAADPAVAVAKTENDARLSLTWPEATATQIAADGQEITLRFSRPLGAAPLDKVPEQLAGWVDNILFGYDSVTLIVNAEAAAAVQPFGAGARVNFTLKPPDKATLAAKAAADKAATQRLDYMRAAVDLEQGRVRAARALLRDLIDRDPRDAQSVRLLAAAEERLGRWRDALGYARRGLALTPDDPDLARSKAALLYAHGDFARADYDVFAVHNADTQRVTKLTGRNDLGGDGAFGYVVERRRVDADKVTRPDGTVTPFHGFRSATTFSYTQDWRDLQASKISLFAADYTLGGGVSHAWRWEESTFRLNLHWREPAYSLLEGVVVGGWRTRAFAEYETRLSPHWLLTATGSLNSYGLDGEDGQLASSATANGTLVYIVYAGSPYVTLGYALDAEYVIDNKFFFDSFGTAFHPMSLATREVHSFQGTFERPLTDYLSWSAAAGYSWDRRNKGAPFANLALRYEPLADLEIGLRVSHARATARGTADAVDSIGGYLTWRY